MNARPDTAPTAPDQSEGGFILPMVLVTIAVMTLALWSAASVFELATRHIRDLRDDATLETDGASVEARLAYILATEPLGANAIRIGVPRISRMQAMGMEGLDEKLYKRRPDTELVLDGRAYRAPQISSPSGSASKLIVKMQDSAGLVNLNTADETVLTRVLVALGKEPRQARQLAAVLADFTDADDLTHLEGAEKDVYRRRGVAPPLDGLLRDPQEAFKALDWDVQLTRQQRAEMLATSRAGATYAATNINTATPEALAAWFGLDKRQLDMTLKSRQANPYLDVYSFSSSIGLTLPQNDLNSYTHPSDTVRLQIERPGARCRMLEVWVTQAPSGSSRPLFFGNRGDKTCPSTRPEQKADDGAASQIPNSSHYIAEGERRADAARP